MKLLITPAGVADLAFRAPDFINPEAIDEATILAATQKFIRPVLGRALCDALLEGSHPEFLEDFVRPPLALYVKMSMLPSLALRTGAAGVVEIHSRNMARADNTKLHTAIRRLRVDAAALMRRAVDHLEAEPATYPLYNPSDNILHRVSAGGGVVLPKQMGIGR
jgi:hypothetical protein